MSSPHRPAGPLTASERREVGRVCSISARGTFTVRAERVVDEGTIVTDPSGRFRGRVVRVFGPVAHPYLSIAPRRSLPAEEALALVGTELLMEVRRREH